MLAQLGGMRTEGARLSGLYELARPPSQESYKVERESVVESITALPTPNSHLISTFTQSTLLVPYHVAKQPRPCKSCVHQVDVSEF